MLSMAPLSKDNWSRKASVYHVYPRSFKDTNADGIGDLEGIINSLDYFNDGTEQSLGVDALWLSPIYPSPGKDFGYDVTDHKAIDPLMGDMATFETLLVEAKRRNIRILLDYVPNHTSDEHPWFLESRQSRDNSKRDWYIWRDPAEDGSPPNNWLSVFGGSAWTFDEVTGQYYLHHHFSFQPDLNWRNPEVRKEMLDVLRFWLDKGVSGFRTDAVYTLIEDASFVDNPPNPEYRPGKDDPYLSLIHTHDEGNEETYAALGEMCAVLSEYDDACMVSESYVDVPTLGKLYDACKDGRHAPLNFSLISLPWDAGEYRSHIEALEETLDGSEWPNYVLGNHDRRRVADRVGRERARLLAILQMTLRGMPFIYYGEEIGMKGVELADDMRKDPLSAFLPGLHMGRDSERGPMQWNGTKHAGFTEGEPWLSVADDHELYNVVAEAEDPNSFLSLYRQLLWHRKKSNALSSGEYRSFDAGAGDVLAYERTASLEKVCVVLNFSTEDRDIALPFQKAEVVASTHMRKDKEIIEGATYRLRGYEGLVLSIHTDGS
jgi:alpha-glucosidase